MWGNNEFLGSTSLHDANPNNTASEEPQLLLGLTNLQTLQPPPPPSAVGAAAAGRIHSNSTRTVFITGFPLDLKERELHNLLRFIPGYSFQAHIVYPQGRGLIHPQPQAFALFNSTDEAYGALRFIHGLHFCQGYCLRAELARTDMRFVASGGDDTAIACFGEGNIGATVGGRGAVGGTGAAASGRQHHSLTAATAPGMVAKATAMATTPLQLPKPSVTLNNNNNNPHNANVSTPHVYTTTTEQLLSLTGPSSISSSSLSPLAVSATAPTTGTAMNTINHNQQQRNQQQQHRDSNTKVIDDNPPCNTLFIGNLSDNIADTELLSVFQLQPGFLSLKLNKGLKRQPICFVEFDSAESAFHSKEQLQGVMLASNLEKGGLRLSFAKQETRSSSSTSSSKIDLASFAAATTTNAAAAGQRQLFF
jgi:hypothetical protein